MGVLFDRDNEPSYIRGREIRFRPYFWMFIIVLTWALAMTAMSISTTCSEKAAIDLSGTMVDWNRQLSNDIRNIELPGAYACGRDATVLIANITTAKAHVKRMDAAFAAVKEPIPDLPEWEEDKED